MYFSLQKIGSHQIDASKGFLYCSIIKITIRVIFFDNFWQFLEDGDFRYDADNQTLTFQTNQFSDCAIAYKDVKKSGQTGRNDSNGTKKDKPTGNTPTSIYSPQTGDTTDLSGYVILLIASVTVITGWLILRKKKCNKEDNEHSCGFTTGVFQN